MAAGKKRTSVEQPTCFVWGKNLKVGSVGMYVDTAVGVMEYAYGQQSNTKWHINL